MGQCEPIFTPFLLAPWIILRTFQQRCAITVGVSRYSLLYIDRGRPASDSDRARTRRYTIFKMLIPRHYHMQLAEIIASELGVEVKSFSSAGSRKYRFDTYFENCEMRDLLDTITFIYDLAKNDDIIYDETYERNLACELWHAEVTRILEEENLAYRLDDDAVVCPYIDAEFEANRASAIDALGQSKFREARADFEAAFRHLRNGEGKQALRMMFPAVETAAKVLFPGAFPRFMPNEVERHLKPRISYRYDRNEPAIKAAGLLLDGLKDWINAAQLYRHGQEQEELAGPPVDFVVAHLSAGATYLRWMIELCSTR